MTEPRGSRPLIYAAALLWGLQVAFLSPALALLLSEQMHATDTQVGLALALYNGSGFVASLVIPAWADRTRSFLPWMQTCALLSLALATALALTDSLWLSITVLVLLGGPAAVGSSLFFAFVRVSGAGAAAVMNTRAVVSAGWVAGPPVAMLLAGSAGIRTVPAAVALLAAGSSLVIWLLRRHAARNDAPSPSTDEPAVAMSRVRVAAVVVAFIALQAANATATSSMSLFAVGTLELAPVWGGVALAVAALAEIPALWSLGRLSRRCSSTALLAVGCLCGTAYFVLLALVNGPIMLVAIQLLNAWFFATVAGVGLTLFQDIMGRPGLASGIYMNTYRVGAILSGGLIAFAGTGAGFAGTYLVCGTLTAVALVIVLVAARGTRGTRQSTA
ncbi:MFS transporter [Salana multivorans]